jgi:steroid 5-alpha reductase family enzyme
MVERVMGTVLLELGLLMAVYATLWFGLSVYFKRNDIADVAWGLGFVLMAVYLLITLSPGPITLLVFALVALWAFRLAWHIFRRLKGKPEDFRYRQWRESWGKHVYWRSYLQVYLLQAFLALVIATPLVVAALATPGHIGWLHLPGLLIWLAGFGLQVVADRQLAHFILTRSDRSVILQTGLWRYSRHPNYFGEILMWWGLFILVLPLPLGWVAIISPLTITWLLVFVSGVPLLEERYKGNAGYEVYRQRTSALIPWFPKKELLDRQS